MITVTQYINQFAPPFDADVVAGKVAAKKGTTKEAILAEWETNRDKALSDGNQFEQDVIYVLNNGKSHSEDARYNIAVNSTARMIQKECGKATPTMQMPFHNGNVKGVADFFRDGKVPYIAETKYMKADVHNDFEKLLTPFDAFDNAKVFVCSMQLFCYMLIADEKEVKATLLGCDKANRDSFFYFSFKKETREGKKIITCTGSTFHETTQNQLNVLAKLFIEQWTKDN